MDMSTEEIVKITSFIVCNYKSETIVFYSVFVYVCVWDFLAVEFSGWEGR